MTDKQDKELRYKANDLLVNCSTYFGNDQLEAALDIFEPLIQEAVTQARKEQIARDWVQAGKDVQEAVKAERERIRLWGNEKCTEHRALLRHSCPECWQALKGGN